MIPVMIGQRTRQYASWPFTSGNCPYIQNYHFIVRSQNKSPPAKKVLHTTTVGLRGRSDSVTSNESLDLGIRSEKPTMHERSTPTKTKAPALIINRNDNVRTSQEAGVVSLPELAISSTELGEGKLPYIPIKP